MLPNLTLLLLCQLAGEALVAWLGLPIPGPVLGMALLFTGLQLRGLPPGLAAVGDGLLSNLSLLFVPAGVGVMLHARLIAADGLAIGVSLIGSTLFAIAVTGLAMRALAPKAGEGGE